MEGTSVKAPKVPRGVGSGVRGGGGVGWALPPDPFPGGEGVWGAVPPPSPTKKFVILHFK